MPGIEEAKTGRGPGKWRCCVSPFIYVEGGGFGPEPGCKEKPTTATTILSQGGTKEKQSSVSPLSPGQSSTPTTRRGYKSFDWLFVGTQSGKRL